MRKVLITLALLVATATPAWATSGGPGDDVIHGTPGQDVLRGGPGDDVIYSGRGADAVFGGQGFDICYVGPRDAVVGCEEVR